MNSILVPFNWVRHVVIGLTLGAASVVAWWLFLCWMVVLGPALFQMGLLWSVKVHGAYLLSLVAVVLSSGSILIEDDLYQRPILNRVGRVLLAGVITLVGSLLGIWLVSGVQWLFVSEIYSELMADVSLVTLRYRLLQWLTAGFFAALGPLVVRRGAGFFGHVIGGPVAASVGCALWHYLGFHVFHDYYLATALGIFVWGTLYGALVWGVPRDLYTGWIRVVSDYRFSYRIPIDLPDGGSAERFVGHFPRGLDMQLPVERGVAELHASFLVSEDQRYAVRGLSIAPLHVKRFLEHIDLRYDPQKPAPLETEIFSGDRFILSDGQAETYLEFVLLPKEAR